MLCCCLSHYCLGFCSCPCSRFWGWGFVLSFCRFRRFSPGSAYSRSSCKCSKLICPRRFFAFHCGRSTRCWGLLVLLSRALEGGRSWALRAGRLSAVASLLDCYRCRLGCCRQLLQLWPSLLPPWLPLQRAISSDGQYVSLFPCWRYFLLCSTLTVCSPSSFRCWWSLSCAWSWAKYTKRSTCRVLEFDVAYLLVQRCCSLLVLFAWTTEGDAALGSREVCDPVC